MKYTIRINLFFRILMIAFAIISLVAFLHLVITDVDLSFQDWFFLLTGLPLFVVGGFFILPTKKINMDADKLSIYWKIAIGKYIFYESNNYEVFWDKVTSVYSIFPIWIPFKVFVIYGSRKGRSTIQPLYGYTNQKAAMVFIADHVKSDVVDDELSKLIKNYRKQLVNNKKEN